MGKMLAPKLTVVLDDDTEYTVQTDNRDMVRFDLLRNRMKWPGMQEAPVLWMTVLAWSCLAREGKLSSEGIDKQLDRILSVDVVDDEGNPVALDDVEAMSVDPT